MIAQKLEQLNQQLADKNRQSRRIWKVVAGILIFFIVFIIMQLILSFSAYQSFEEKSSTKIISQMENQIEERIVAFAFPHFFCLIITNQIFIVFLNYQL